ncbi:hypothetical protein HAX54_002242, partial [Datura stramonium]|nr:hypothetical protein [Datura stramonium]
GKTRGRGWAQVVAPARGQARAPSPKLEIEIEELQHQPEGVGPAQPLIGFVAMSILQDTMVRIFSLLRACCKQGLCLTLPMFHELEMRHGLTRRCVVRPIEAAKRSPVVRVFSVVLSPEENFMVEVTLNTFGLAGLFRRHYKLHREARVHVKLHKAHIPSIQVMVASLMQQDLLIGHCQMEDDLSVVSGSTLLGSIPNSLITGGKDCKFR